ncbi:ribosomal RNA large subunit methyltransferase E [Arenicella chitinivorans]|uniref:Ribosomal RNA large subunit methyltransferase E n=1 Tax=Arenicella chitinivorans TaxID=1329800 RepID=A0A918RLE6_9GAMM|nr:RlmE family RNA methyltransferase [Arenicella chitinivorans]GGZ99514.1 ribosomal RNA large subunit methyltransferase E [Arenicella chitinivorans]
MARKGNKTGEWVRRHVNDPYVKKATSQGYRSRAVYKFKEIDDQDKLVKSGMVVVDLGCAPGGWSQYIARKFGGSVTVIGVDLLPMDPIDNVTFIQGDFQDPDILARIDEILDGRDIDLVISDMAPNITGVRSVDEAQYEGLLDSVLYFCDQRLKAGNHLLVKLFEGSAAHYYRREVKSRFKSGVVRKPGASRAKSREYYFLAKHRIAQ